MREGNKGRKAGEKGQRQTYSVTLGERNKELEKKSGTEHPMLLWIKPFSGTINMPCVSVKVLG